MKHQSSSSKQLIKIRREQRNKQLQQVCNSFRFITVAKNTIEQTHQYGSSHKLTQPQLEEIIHSNDLNKLYFFAAQEDYQNEEILETNALRIIQFLKQRLNIPLAALTLSCLIKKIQLFNVLAYKQLIINKIVYHMDSLQPTIQTQSIYMWLLCAATQQPQIVQKQQLQGVMPILQHTLKDLVANKQKQDYILVQLLKNLSEMRFIFSINLVTNLTTYFWKVNKQTILLNIYFICVNLLKQTAFEPSTKTLIYMVAVYLKGRTKISMNIDSYVPGIYKIMMIVLNSYKSMAQHIKQQQIQINQAKITTTLHSFLLQYEPQIFKNNQHSFQYLSFLLQFCTHSPVNQTLKNWFKFGVIENLVDILTLSTEKCELSLKIIYTLSYRVHIEQRDYLMLEATISYCKIPSAIEEATHYFSSAQLNRLAEAVLKLLVRTD